MKSVTESGTLSANVFCAALVLSLIGTAPQPSPLSKTFTHARWEVALDYPGDWSAEDNGEDVTFESPAGASIVLSPAASESRADPAPGRRAAQPSCTTTTTRHDVVATTCIDAASHAERAVLVLEPHTNRERRLMLRSRGADPRVFRAIVASVRAITAAPAARFLVRVSPRTTRARLRRS